MKRSTLALLLLTALILGGCAGGATFVSTAPPPDTSGDAWFVAGAQRVRNAVARAMQDRGFAIDGETSGPALVVGRRTQRLAETADAVEPPVYTLRCVIARQGNTHVRATIDPTCPACDGATEFVWDYPADLLRDVLERTRTLLGERRARVDLPPRYRPPRRKIVPRRP